MTKRLMAKTGEYQKDGQTKGEYVKIGVMLSGQNGDYMLLDPTVSLAGVLLKQNDLAFKQGKAVHDTIMVSIFEDQPQQQQQPQQGYQQQAPQQGYQQQPQQPQQGFQQPQQGNPQY